MFGHTEHVPRHISRFHIRQFEKSIVLKNVEHGKSKFAFVAGFGASRQGASVTELPAALRRPQKKHTHGFWNMYFADVVFFKRFQGPLVKFSSYGWSARMTMPARRASKFCEIRCAGCLPILFSKLDFLGNTWDVGTLAWEQLWL